jgi:hypothetical protein
VSSGSNEESNQEKNKKKKSKSQNKKQTLWACNGYAIGKSQGICPSRKRKKKKKRKRKRISRGRRTGQKNREA